MEVELHFGDCLEVMNKIEKGSVDLILTDLPYGTTQAKWDTIIDLEKLWKQYNRVLKKDGACVLFCKQPFTSVLVSSNIRNFKYAWIWRKCRPTNGLNAKRQPLREYEEIAVFYRRQCTYNPQGLVPLTEEEVAGRIVQNGNHPLYKEGNEGKGKKLYGDLDTESYNPSEKNYPKDILEIDDIGERYRSPHPTAKPTNLLEYLIKTYTDEGQVVLDSCMGGGSTGIAAVRTGRSFIGIELDEDYFKHAKLSIEKELEKVK